MAANKARRIHDEAILVDGMGVAVLLPTALIPQPEWKGKPFLDRAIAAAEFEEAEVRGKGAPLSLVKAA